MMEFIGEMVDGTVLASAVGLGRIKGPWMLIQLIYFGDCLRQRFVAGCAITTA
jgi:hypothetical protein